MPSLKVARNISKSEVVNRLEGIYLKLERLAQLSPEFADSRQFQSALSDILLVSNELDMSGAGSHPKTTH